MKTITALRILGKKRVKQLADGMFVFNQMWTVTHEELCQLARNHKNKKHGKN